MTYYLIGGGSLWIVYYLVVSPLANPAPIPAARPPANNDPGIFGLVSFIGGFL